MSPSSTSAARFVLVASAALGVACGGREEAGEVQGDAPAADAASDAVTTSDARDGDPYGTWVEDRCCKDHVVTTCRCPYPGCGLPPYTECGGGTCVDGYEKVCPGDAGPDTLPDGPTLDDAPPGSCNALLNDAVTVTLMQVATAMPSPSGGTIVPGTYHRTAWTRYTGAGGASGPGTETDRTTGYFVGGEFQIVGSYDGAPNIYSTGKYVTSDKSITLVRSCPAPTMVSPYTGYTATPTSIVLFAPSTNQTLTYTMK